MSRLRGVIHLFAAIATLWLANSIAPVRTLGAVWADPGSYVDAGPDVAPAEGVGLPIRLRIPAVNVDAGFEYVGLTPEGAMGTPRNPDDVAWYRWGPRPGQPGNAAIAGHVDWAGQIRAFWWLRKLSVGDIIDIVADDGQTYRFSVRWLRLYPATGAPVDEIFGDSDTPEITLVTCGGVFDHQTKQYLSRFVVRAALQGESPTFPWGMGAGY